MSFFLIRVVRDVADHFQVRASEWALGSMLALWGWVLLLPSETFSISSSFDMLLRVMPENAWGLACLIVGLARVVVLFINGAWRRSPHMRALAALFSCFFWFQISLSIIVGGKASPGLAIYPVLMLLDIFHVFRCVAKARVSDDMSRLERGEHAGGK